jgi:hypothetical protein
MIRSIEYEKIGDVYLATKAYVYFSPRYRKALTIPQGYPSNGANAVKDKCPTAFFVHDYICNEGEWDDETQMCNREASTVYADILKENGFWWRSKIRWLGTYLGGGGQARDNGMWKVKT